MAFLLNDKHIKKTINTFVYLFSINLNNMIRVIKVKRSKGNNRVFLTNKIANIKNLNSEEIKYFKKNFKTDKVQFLKTTKGITFVININKETSDSIRIAGFKAHQELKNTKNCTIICENTINMFLFLEGFILSNYQFLKYFGDAKEKANKINTLYVITNASDKEITAQLNVLKSVYWAKDMVNEPVSYLDSIRIAEELKTKGMEANFSVDIFEQTKIETLKMGGLLAVNQGSETPATFTIMEYKPKNAVNKKPYVLVGKGVVYDTGGLSLKPTPNSMDFMKTDMGGAACVSGTIYALALNKIPVHIIALVPATDNRPGKNAYAPGDVVTMFDGTTVEVLNTDAEGRMILADAIAYANKYKPELIIDAATLTGASVRAVGVKTAVFMGNAKEKYMKLLKNSGQKTHDRVVRFPFWDEWKDEMKSDIADLKNLGGPYAGMITAGKFLEHFAKFPFIHIDLSNAYLHSPNNYNGKGATGAGVRLLYNFFEKLSYL